MDLTELIATRRAVVAVVGLGDIGLQLMHAFHKAGFSVVGFGVDPHQIAMLKSGQRHLENLSPEMATEMPRSGRFDATVDTSRLAEADAIIVCVPPPLGRYMEPDMTFIEKASNDIAAVIRPNQLIVVESSTNSSGVCEIMLQRFAARGMTIGKDLFVAFSPDREDRGLKDHSPKTNPKFVDGIDDASTKLAVTLYEKAIADSIPASTAVAAVAIARDLHGQGVGRRAGLEYARFAACLAIVWFHTCPYGTSVAYAGLPLLLAMSVALAGDPTSNRSSGIKVRKRVARLLLPWAFWSLIYAAAKLAEVLLAKKPLAEEFSSWMLLTGPAIHLWYLPFAFVATTLAALAGQSQWTSRRLASPVTFALLGVTVFVVVSGAMAGGIAVERPFAQWAVGLPAVPIGLAFASCRFDGRRFYTAGVAVAVIMAAITVWLLGWRGIAIPYSVGIVALSIAWIVGTGQSHHAEMLGALSYGMYLVHPLIGAVLARAMSLGEVAFTFTVMAASIAVTVVIKRTPLRAFV